MDRFLGWHPSAYVGRDGVSDTPQDQDRKAGTRMIHAQAGYELPGPMRFSVAGWFAQDTSLTGLDAENLLVTDTPVGYSREEFLAEQRLGEILGEEIDVTVGAELTPHVDASLGGAVLLPGPF